MAGNAIEVRPGKRPASGPTIFTISDLAEEFDITTRAIRHYEAEGLLTPKRRGNRRVYSRRDRVRLSLILRGKRLGFSLNDTRELFDLYDSASDEGAQLSHFVELLDERRHLLERQMQDIREILREIDAAQMDALRTMSLRNRRQMDDNETTEEVRAPDGV